MTNASERIGLFATILLLLATGRAWSLASWFAVVPGPAPAVVRELCRVNDFRPELIVDSPMAREIGLQLAQPLVFDSSAAVLLCPGADARPGKADVDDDADGVVDNASELGAMYSDDVCLAPTEDGYSQALENDACKVISRGAWVLTNRQADDRPSRLVLSGRLNGRAWQRLVVSRQ